MIFCGSEGRVKSETLKPDINSEKPAADAIAKALGLGGGLSGGGDGK